MVSSYGCIGAVHDWKADKIWVWYDFVIGFCLYAGFILTSLSIFNPKHKLDEYNTHTHTRAIISS